MTYLFNNGNIDVRKVVFKLRGVGIGKVLFIIKYKKIN